MLYKIITAILAVTKTSHAINVQLASPEMTQNGVTTTSYEDYVALRKLSYDFRNTVEFSHRCFLDDNPHENEEWCDFFLYEAMHVL